MRKRYLILILLLACAPAHAEEILRFYGYAYDLKTNRYLYTEVHEQHIQDDRWTGGSMSYYAPDGSPIGHKTLDFSKDPYVPLYRLTLNARGYSEAITGVGQTIDLSRRSSADEGEKHVSIRRNGPMAADSGFHSFIRAHFAELMAGQTVDFRMIAAGNLDSFKFRIKRVEDTRFEGKPAIRLRVEPDSLLRWLVDPLELTYEPQEHKLLEYRGIANVRDPATGKAYNARILYSSRPPADAPARLPPLNPG